MWAEHSFPIGARVNPRSGAPYAPQSPQVEGSGQQSPFGRRHCQSHATEIFALPVFDDPEDGFDQLLSPLEGGPGCIGSHPGTMTAQGRIIGAYDQPPSVRTIGDARRHDRTRLANTHRGLIHPLVRFPGVLAAYEAQHLALGASVRVAVGILGEPVLVVGMVLCLSFGRLWHHHLLTAISTFLKHRCRVIAGIGQGQWRLDSDQRQLVLPVVLPH